MGHWKTEAGRVHPTDLPAKVRSAKLLDGDKVEFNQPDRTLVLTIPLALVQAVDTIVQVKLERSAMEISALESEL